MQSLARFSLKALVCHTIHGLINNLTKLVHSDRKMFITSSYCILSLFKKKKVSAVGKGHHLHAFNRAVTGARSFCGNLQAFSHCWVKSYFAVRRNICFMILC